MHELTPDRYYRVDVEHEHELELERWKDVHGVGASISQFDHPPNKDSLCTKY